MSFNHPEIVNRLTAHRELHAAGKREEADALVASKDSTDMFILRGTDCLQIEECRRELIAHIATGIRIGSVIER